jgi:hypothetical protein
MYSFRDEESGIVIHHNGDYSGEAMVVIPVGAGDETFQQGLGPEFAFADKYGTRYGLDFYETPQGRFVEVKVPASVLVAFAGEAVRNALIAKLEDVRVDRVL